MSNTDTATYGALMVVSKRFRTLSIRFNEHEHAEISTRAKATGMTFGQYMRHQSLSAPSASAANTAVLTPDGTVTNLATVVPSSQPESARQNITSYKLDELGSDPLRGGARSSRR